MEDRSILRIVKLQFKDDCIESFLLHFNTVKERVATSEGCHQMMLQRDKHNPAIFFTISSWVSEEHLNNYRASSFFEDTWKKIKPWFSERAQAWTTENYFNSALRSNV